MDGMEPLLRVYFDVDGVLSPITNDDTRPAAETRWGWSAESRREGYAIWDVAWSAELIDQVNSLTTLPGVETIWNTSWDETAVCFGELVGLVGCDTWRVADTSRTNSDTWAKWANVKGDYDQNPVPFIWVDDHLSRKRAATSWVKSVGGLHLSPETHVGLTPQHLRKMREFAADVIG